MLRPVVEGPKRESTVSPNSDSPKSIRSSANDVADVAQHEDGDTFYDMLSIHLDQPVGSMSISEELSMGKAKSMPLILLLCSTGPSNRDVALGARKGLFIVDLQNPYDPPRFLPHNSAWEVADVQWSPFPVRNYWVASTVASPIEHTLHAHTRAVTDINWSPASPDVLATCALDGWVWSWDLRTGYGSKTGAGGGRKPVWGVSSWGSGATQVKWNRRQPHIIASAHGNRVMIWDDRFGASPVSIIQGHSAKIYGIDWSRRNEDRLLTCSLDKSFRYWTLNDVKSPLLTVQTSSPVWRARFLPFGEGALTLPQRNDHALSIWAKSKVEREAVAEPIARFEGAREGIKEFVWRTRGGSDLNYDDRQFQLVTWAKDRRLRLWPIADEILREVGHEKGSPISIPMTRRGGADISFRILGETNSAKPTPLTFTSPGAPIPKHLAPVTSLLSASLSSSPAPPSSTMSSVQSSSTSALPLNSTLSSSVACPITARRGAATMTATLVRSRRQKAYDRLVWMEGVKVIKPLDNEPLLGLQKQAAYEFKGLATRSSSAQRGTDGGTAREGGETERADSMMSPADSLVTGTAVGKEVVHVNLGEEMTAVVRRFPRINFEKVHIAGRTCTVSLYSPFFLRATFTFPKNYPNSAPSVIELERTADMTLKIRAYLLQSVRKILSSRAKRGLPSLDLALRFLLGDRSVLDDKPIAPEEDDDDDADETLGSSTAGAVPSEILRNNFNVLPPRRGGAVFGPQGQLVVFFPTNFFISTIAERDDAQMEVLPFMVKLPPRVSEKFGILSNGNEYERESDHYQESDEALQIGNGLSLRTSTDSVQPQNFETSSTSPVVPSFSSIVHIKNASHLTLVRHGQKPLSVLVPPLTLASEAMLRALGAKDSLSMKVWTSLVSLLKATEVRNLDLQQQALGALLAEHLLPEILAYLVHLKDIESLGLISCLLENYSRSLADSIPQSAVLSAPTTEIDYFSHRTPLSPTESEAQTPLASTYRSRRSEFSQSPRASWTNLTGYFNNGGSSNRQHTPPSSATQDRSLLKSNQSASSWDITSQLSPHPQNSPIKAGVRQYSSSRPSPTLSKVESSPPIHRQPSKLREKKLNSPNVSFGSTSIATIASRPVPDQLSDPSSTMPGQDNISRILIKLPDPRFLPKPVCWWLSDQAQLELELIRLAYAELLYRWGFQRERLQVLKLCHLKNSRLSSGHAASLVRIANGYSTSSGIEILTACHHCGVPLTSMRGRCSSCRHLQNSATCSLCHLPVNELTQQCTLCFHLGHLDCLQEWNTAQESCSTGCGCNCAANGGLSGIFLVPPPKAPNPPPKPMRHWSVLRSSLPYFH